MQKYLRKWSQKEAEKKARVDRKNSSRFGYRNFLKKNMEWKKSTGLFKKFLQN